MVALREHGGAVQYWRNEDTGQRAVRCQDGTHMLMVGHRWRVLAPASHGLVEEAGWQSDTRPSATAAVTRTGREARRRNE